MKRPTPQQQQLLKRLVRAGCAVDMPLNVTSPLRVTGKRNPPRALFFPTLNGTGVALELRITATEPFHPVGYEITLDAGGQSAGAIDRCKEHGGQFCLHQKSGSLCVPERETLNVRIGRLGRLKAGDSIFGSLFAEFDGDVSLDPEVEHPAKLCIRDHRGSEYAFPLRLVSSKRVAREEAARKKQAS
jgi:hypothetical protein